MNIQAIYDRLQCDVAGLSGLPLRLTISRVSQYEALWKNLLALIEECGAAMPQSIEHCKLPESNLAVIIVLTGGNKSVTLGCPLELVELVLRFLQQRSALMLRCLRQVCLFTYKSKSYEVTEEQVNSAVLGFVSRNTTCQGLSYSHYQRLAGGGSDVSETLKIARLLCGIVCDRVDWREIRPSHGPGSVADAKRGIDKWRQLDGCTTKLCDKMYPLAEYFSPTPDSFDYNQARYTHSVCKLAVVPKDKRGPRIICTQPVGLMWIQKGQQKALERAIESSSITQTNRNLATGPSLLGGTWPSIKFDRQENNGCLALESSQTREFATIDLSDASDLVSWGLVRYLLNKENVRFLAASRAMYVKLPSGQLEKLHMFAPMGSAMCFPIESLVFWAIASSATLVQRGVTYRELTRFGARKGILQNPREVFVFGDDILVRSESCEFVCERLREVGFKPNLGKTFYKGFYRESCGVDAYLGERLDIARLQYNAITSMPAAYASIDLSNRCRALGMVHLAQFLECQVESYLGFGLAAGVTGGMFWKRGWPCNYVGALEAHIWNEHHNRKVRYNADLQVYEARTIIARPQEVILPQDDRCRLFRGLTVGVDEHTNDWLNPDNMKYTLGWVVAY